MGEIDEKAFVMQCKKKYKGDEALMKASKGCSLWQKYLGDPAWHPFKIIETNGKNEVNCVACLHQKLLSSSLPVCLSFTSIVEP